MQINKLAAACAIAFAGVSSPVFALGAFDAPDLTVFLSGASAPDNFLDTIATNMFVGAKGTDWYKYNNGTHSRAYFGTMKAATTTNPIPASLVGKKVLFIKRSSGGSVFGVNPVARGEALANIKIASGTGGCTAGAIAGEYNCPTVGKDPGVAGYPAGGELIPDFGVSDVAPVMFKSPYNVEFGKTQLSTAEAGNLLFKPVNTLAMGLAVTNAIPDTTYLSRAVYGAMLAGNLTDWTSVDPSLAPTAGTQVIVCRRTPGSGTQASYNWYFNNFPCAKGSVAGSGDTAPTRMSDSQAVVDGLVTGTGTEADPFVIDPALGYTVLENAGSGDVVNCMKKAAAGGDHTFQDEEKKYYKVPFGTGGYGAIAVLSVDSLDKTGSAADKWSYRSTDGAGMYYDSEPLATVSGGALNVTPAQTGDGVHPSKENLIDAKYDFQAELTMQYRKAGAPGGALTGLKLAFADYFIARAGAPTFNNKPWVNALPPYDPTTTADVAKASRNGNMCAPLQRTY